MWQTPCQSLHALKTALPCRFSLIIEREQSVRGHFARTSDTADTPQNAATPDRSSGARLRDEVNQTLATLANSIHGDSGNGGDEPCGFDLPHGLNRLRQIFPACRMTAFR